MSRTRHTSSQDSQEPTQAAFESNQVGVIAGGNGLVDGLIGVRVLSLGHVHHIVRKHTTNAG